MRWGDPWHTASHTESTPDLLDQERQQANLARREKPIDERRVHVDEVGDRPDRVTRLQGLRVEPEALARGLQVAHHLGIEHAAQVAVELRLGQRSDRHDASIPRAQRDTPRAPR